MKKNILFIFVIIFSLTGCINQEKIEKEDEVKAIEESGVLRDKFFFLSSILNVNILDEDCDKDKILKEIKESITTIEEKMSFQFENSEVNLINKNAGIKPIKVSDDTFYVIKKGIEYSKISNGKFDISVGNLVKLWNIGTKDARVPTEDEIKNALSTINYNDIVLDEEKKEVYLTKKGMMIDLGGIAKGYVTDKINEIFKKYDVKSAITNLGGNIYVYGTKNGEDFKVGIREPFSKNPDNHFLILETSDNSVVTSGIYERFFEENNKIYHHILSTETGYPIDNNLVSTSIITKNSIDADALSTTVFALGLEKGLELIENMRETEAIFVTKDKKIYLTPGLKDRVTFENDNYEVYLTK